MGKTTMKYHGKCEICGKLFATHTSLMKALKEGCPKCGRERIEIYNMD